jgi:hypothetical protein
MEVGLPTRVRGQEEVQDLVDLRFEVNRALSYNLFPLDIIDNNE